MLWVPTPMSATILGLRDRFAVSKAAVWKPFSMLMGTNLYPLGIREF